MATRRRSAALASSQKQEREGARRHGGTVNSGSGSGLRKNDVVTPRQVEWPESIEFKQTSGIYYRLMRDDLLKAEEQALKTSRHMAFGIEFTHMNQVVGQYAVLHETDYLSLLARVREQAGEIASLQGQLAISRDNTVE